MDSISLVRRLPAVGRLLNDPVLRDVIELYGRDAVTVQAQQQIDTLRRQILAAAKDPAAEGSDETSWTRRIEGLPEALAEQVRRRLGGRRRVINATGIQVHTNLGRSPLPREVIDEISPLLTDYTDLEVDLETGKRGERNRGVVPLLRLLCGAESALVANNNAAAMVLVLQALAAGREVIVSRGELVEIGGSFRIPDILEAAGARLREVGTTNRTHLEDYEQAVSDDTALLLKVHTSNYRIRGFTREVPARELADLGRRRGVPLLADEGSGLLVPSDRPQLADHPSISELVADGCDLVCGSGDKVLGGPQAGILVGRADLVERCRRFPLYRALRPDRFTFAALEAVLRRHAADRPMPLDRLWQDPRGLRRRLEAAAAILDAEIVPADAYVGGGSAPDASIPGWALALPADDAEARRLRLGGDDIPAVVGYLQEGRLILDLRTVDPRDDETLVKAVLRALDRGARQ